jgi:hypothetical protein
VQQGFAAFRIHCSRCHPVNGEGGTIGPELNRAEAPAGRRDAKWLHDWIDDPSRISPGTRMERLNPDLPDRGAVIASIIAYLQAIATPGRAGGGAGPFEAFYASAWQQPSRSGSPRSPARRSPRAARSARERAALCARAHRALALRRVAHREPRARDRRAARAARDAVPLFFVLAGDFRYLLLWEAATPDGAIALTPRGRCARGALTAIVPILAQLATRGPRAARALPRLRARVLRAHRRALRWHPNARALPWVRAVSRFVLLYYGLWAAADVVLLATGADAGFALRVIPNLLYYGGLRRVARLAPPPSRAAH